MSTDLLVSYPWRQFGSARREILRVLRRFGDPQPTVEKSGVPGVAVAHTALNNREVVNQCRALFQAEPVIFVTLKWVPVDWWCETDLDAMKKVIEERVRGQIHEGETWGMKVEKRRWGRYHTREIIEYLAASIDRSVNLTDPDKTLRIDVLGPRTAISLLGRHEIFSVAASHL